MKYIENEESRIDYSDEYKIIPSVSFCDDSKSVHYNHNTQGVVEIFNLDKADRVYKLNDGQIANFVNYNYLTKQRFQTCLPNICFHDNKVDYDIRFNMMNYNINPFAKNSEYHIFSDRDEDGSIFKKVYFNTKEYRVPFEFRGYEVDSIIPLRIPAVNSCPESIMIIGNKIYVTISSVAAVTVPYIYSSGSNILDLYGAMTCELVTLGSGSLYGPILESGCTINCLICESLLPPEPPIIHSGVITKIVVPTKALDAYISAWPLFSSNIEGG